MKLFGTSSLEYCPRPLLICLTNYAQMSPLVSQNSTSTETFPALALNLLGYFIYIACFWNVNRLPLKKEVYSKFILLSNNMHCIFLSIVHVVNTSILVSGLFSTTWDDICLLSIL